MKFPPSRYSWRVEFAQRIVPSFVFISGHLFITHTNIKQLLCDGWLVSVTSNMEPLNKKTEENEAEVLPVDPALAALYAAGPKFQDDEQQKAWTSGSKPVLPVDLLIDPKDVQQRVPLPFVGNNTLLRSFKCLSVAFIETAAKVSSSSMPLPYGFQTLDHPTTCGRNSHKHLLSVV